MVEMEGIMIVGMVRWVGGGQWFLHLRQQVMRVQVMTTRLGRTKATMTRVMMMMSPVFAQLLQLAHTSMLSEFFRYPTLLSQQRLVQVSQSSDIINEVQPTYWHPTNEKLKHQGSRQFTSSVQLGNEQCVGQGEREWLAARTAVSRRGRRAEVKDILQFLMEQGEQAGTVEQEVHFYASGQQLSQRRSPRSRTLEQILLDRVSSDDHIAEIYSCLNDKIEAFRAAGRRADSPNQINQYLAIKAKLYFAFYRGAPEGEGAFEVEQLYELFVDVVSIRDQLKACIYKMHGAERRRRKVEGYLLIFKIEGLLKEIANAAFPSLLYPRKGTTITTPHGDITLTEFHLILLEKQLKERRKFKIEELSPLWNSLLELSDEIETLRVEIGKEEEAMGKVDIRESLLVRTEIDVVEKAIRVAQLQAIRFTHEVYAYLHRHIHQAAPNTLEACRQFIEQSPMFKAEISQVVEYGLEKKEGPSVGNYYLYLKTLIHNLHQICKAQPNKATLNKDVSNLLALLEKQLIWNKNDLLLYENYIAALRVQREVQGQGEGEGEGKAGGIISRYLQLIMGHFINKHWGVIDRVIAFEEEFTYCLLTTTHIIDSLIHYQERFTLLIAEFAPHLHILIEMSKIYLKNTDKHAFIEEALAKIYYPSLGEGAKEGGSDVWQSMDTILAIDHQSIDQIRPYLQEIRHSVMLVSCVRRKDLKRNLSKMQQEEYSSLNKVAAYFSRERPSCVIYELKAKILLFITLFRMGYHSPTVRQEHGLVNLRSRIINLYNKLYSHNAASMLMSRMSSISISMRRSSSQESYIIYDPRETGGGSLVRREQGRVELQASEQLLGRMGKFIGGNFVGKEINSKSYLTNLLNILEHELFIFEKNLEQENHQQLSKDYTQHLRNCMGLDQQDPNIDLILNIERLFYLEDYEKAWNMLSKEKANNAQFNVFLERLQSSSSSNEILKFLRLYNLFEKMDHLMLSQEKKADSVRELTAMANANTLYPISQTAIELIYSIKARENRLAQLEQFYLSRLSSKESSEGEGELRECESFLSRWTKGEVRVRKEERINKTLIRIEIGKGYSSHFGRLTEQLKKFYLFNHIGIFKFNSLKAGSCLQIDIQSNPYILKAQENLFQSKIMQIQENQAEKFCRKVLQFILQVLNLFYDHANYYLNAEQIILQTQPFSFCINPFFSIIQRVLNISPNKKNLNRLAIGIKNRQMIEKLIQPFLPQFSASFTAHYFYFLEQLTNIGLKKGNTSSNKLLQLPLFMTMQQKEVFLVYFDNKMSDMCDGFHELQRKLRKEKKYSEVQKLRLSKMKDPVYKNYSYHFIMGGVVESEMSQLRICSPNQQGRLDWISEHKSLMISYDLPKKEGSQQVKQYAYSINYLLKYLRGALAHKIQNNYRIILNISQQFPHIFDYLHRYKVTLEAKFDAAMEAKSNRMREFLLLGQKQRHQLSLILQGKYQGKLLLNSDVAESIATLASHSTKYDNKLIKQLTAQTYKCQKCNQFINIVKKSSKLLDLLIAISNYLAKKNHFLTQEHNFRDCFLAKYYKSHRIIQVFGLLKKVQARHYIILNWWFYIQTELPCLTICLQKIRYTLQE